MPCQCLLNVESLLISSDLIALQLLLEIVNYIPLSPQPAPSHLISSHLLSSHLMSSQFCFHLISALRSSRLLSDSWLFSADHECSLLFSCHLNLSFHLTSASLSLSRIFTALLNSSQLSAAHVSSSYVFSSPLPSSHIV